MQGPGWVEASGGCRTIHEAAMHSSQPSQRQTPSPAPGARAVQASRCQRSSHRAWVGDWGGGKNAAEAVGIGRIGAGSGTIIMLLSNHIVAPSRMRLFLIQLHSNYIVTCVFADQSLQEKQELRGLHRQTAQQLEEMGNFRAAAEAEANGLRDEAMALRGEIGTLEARVSAGALREARVPHVIT